MTDEYDDFRRRLSSYEKGLYFELGRAKERGETLERGWVQQFRLVIAKKQRIIDSARTHGKGVKGVERKSGRISEQETLKQLAQERTALDSGQMTHSRWETVAGEKVPPAVAAELEAMARDFGAKFQHVVISRADALRAMRLGQSLASKQLELFRPYELQRAERARERLANIRRIVKERQEQERVRAAELAAARQVAQEFPAPEQLQRIESPAVEQAPTREPPQPVVEKTPARALETERVINAERAAARQVAQEFPAREQLRHSEPPAPDRTPVRETPQTAVEKAERAAAERVTQEFPAPHKSPERESVEIGERTTPSAAEPASVERAPVKAPDKAPEKNAPEREAAEQKRLTELRIQRETREAQLAKLPPHVAKLAAIGQAHGPERAVEIPPGQAPQVQGHGRDTPGQDRGQTRNR